MEGIKLDTVKTGRSIPYWWVKGYDFQNKSIFISLKNVFVLTNSADSDKMLHNAACHLAKVPIHYSLRTYQIILVQQTGERYVVDLK